MTRHFYTLDQAARVLGVHYETAARWVRTGKIPGVKITRRKVVVPKSKLDALVAGELDSLDKGSTPAIGSPSRWLELVGTLKPKEAAALRRTLKDFEKPEDED